MFTGIGGLDWPWLGEDHRFVCEVDPDARTVLQTRMPGIPNLGDVSTVPWSQVEPVDVLIGGGFPCQPFSVAGRRRGTADDRYLWPAVASAVAALRPRLLILENVPGILTPHGGRPAVWGRVLGDLADLGYDCRWATLRASDVGAPHRRARVLAAAHPGSDRLGTDPGADRRDDQGGSRAGRPPLPTGPEVALAADPPPGGDGPPPDEGSWWPGPAGGDRPSAHPERLGRGSGAGSGPGRAGGVGGDGPGDDRRAAPTDPDRGPGPGGKPFEGRGPGRRAPARRDRQAPPDPDGEGRDRIPPVDRDGGPLDLPSRDDPHRRGDDHRWGPYRDAVARWEGIVGPAPAPTDGRGRLNPRFVEWMMGFPPGWVTDLVPRRAALRLLGNAVVPHQARAALDLLI